MKKVLKSVLMMSLVLASVAGATKAWFTSNITAEENRITTGTLRAAIDSTEYPDGNYDPDSGAGYEVLVDDGTTTTVIGGFQEITNVQPGEEVSVYFSVRNAGSLEMQHRFSVTGEWEGGGLENAMMELRRVHRYAVNNCESQWGCGNIRDWEGTATPSRTWVSAGANNLGLNGDGFYGGNSNYNLDAAEYTIYRVDFRLSPEAGNNYQGQTYLYDIHVDARQTVAGAAWTP